MPRFYFHIRDGQTGHGSLLEDDEGRDLPDAVTAQSEAIADALDILTTRFALVSLGDRRRWSIDVHDSGGRRVLIVPLAEIKVPSAAAIHEAKLADRPPRSRQPDPHPSAGEADCPTCYVAGTDAPPSVRPGRGRPGTRRRTHR